MDTTERLEGADLLSWPDDFKMKRAEAAAFAAALGYPVAVATLAKLAVNGDGPVISYFGHRPLYEVGPFRQWLTSRTRKVRSTAELRRAMQPAAA